MGPASGGMRRGGGFGRQFHGGFTRAVFAPPIRHPFLGFHRFRHRSFRFFNLALFPPYAYYPYSPMYPPYPFYDPGYSASSLYPEPGYPAAPPDDVQVYTAPPEPPVATHSGPQSLPAPAPADDGSIRFEVSPPAAELMLDERYLGKADELMHREVPAPAGQHLLAIRVGVEGTFTQVAVSPHKVTTVRVTLAAPAAPHPRIGRLRLQVDPPGAAIYLDGAFAAVATSAEPTVLPLPPGQHRVQLVMPGHKGYGADVTVPEEGEALLSAQMARE